MNQTQENFSLDPIGTFLSLLKSIGYCVYVIDPRETYHDNHDRMPNFVSKAVPGVLVMMLMEIVMRFFVKSIGPWSFHDNFLNISSAAFNEAFKTFVFRGIELTAYTWVYEKYRFTTLPFDSIYTYIIAILGVDFGYYWWHRAAHETNVLWAAHHYHHSSDYLNISTAIRNNFTMRPFHWVWFLHMAIIGLPPPTFVAHFSLVALYTSWQHEQRCPKLGKMFPVIGDILEFVVSTPSHHRVHHGSNRYCIDKNYGFGLIIWDRMFGTFAEEKEDERITYGSIHQARSFDVIGLQVQPWIDLLKKVNSFNTFGDKLRAIFYGPGWEPGKPRLGNPDEIPDVRGRIEYSIHLPKWFSAYLAIHASLILFEYLDMINRIKTIDPWIPELNFLYMLFALTSIGGLHDAKICSTYLEPARLLVHLILLHYFPLIGKNSLVIGVTMIHVVSLLLCPFIIKHVAIRRNIEKRDKLTNKEIREGTQKTEALCATSRNGKIQRRNLSKMKSKGN